MKKNKLGNIFENDSNKLNVKDKTSESPLFWMHASTMTTIRKCSAPMIIIGIIGLLED
jgi:hypothetical protein